MSTDQVYHTTPDAYIPSLGWTRPPTAQVAQADRPDYPGVNAHDADVLRSRAIAPEVAAARGTRTEGARLMIPLHNTAGEVETTQTRPHVPSVDARTGKTRKYLLERGTRMLLDVHPWSRPHLADPHVPVVITESALKADSILSTIDPDAYAVLSIAGVYGWRSDGAPISDFEDVRWRHKERERVVTRRTVYVAFDSDALTNPDVCRARWGLTEHLRRRGARVRWIDVPDAADGGKQGIDDALASGHALADMLDSADQAPDRIPTLALHAAIDDPEAPKVERLEAENARLRVQVSAYGRLITNPDLTNTERMIGFRLITEAAAAASRGEAGADGRVRLRASVIANDFREKPARGETWAATNPDGTKPLARRDRVKGIAARFGEDGVLPVGFEPTVRKHKTGDRYPDTDMVVDAADPVGAIVKLADYRAEKTRKPYTRQEPCPHCGEVHPRRVLTTARTYCEGCGSKVGEDETMTRIIPIPVASDPEATGDERERLEARVSDPADARKNGEAAPDDLADRAAPKKGEEVYVGGGEEGIVPAPKKGEAHRTRKHGEARGEPEPGWLWGSPDAMNACACGAPLPSGRKWTCSDGCTGRVEVPA